MRRSFVSPFLAIAISLLVAVPAWAAKSKKKAEPEPAAEEVNLDEDTSSEAKKDEGEKKEGEATTDEAPKEEEGTEKAEGDGERPVEPAEDDEKASPVEHAGQTYRFVGLRYRLLIVPKFVMNLFGEGGTTLLVHSFGPEFTIRKDAFEYSFAVSYTPYSMDETPFKASSDPEEAWEVVESGVKVVYLTADFMWSQPLSKQVSFIYGGGAGIGLVFGSLYRTQAYLDGGTYRPCPGDPAAANPPYAVGDPRLQYCQPEPDDDPQHYPGYTEPSWADGGSKPIIFPWIAIQTGIRWKPHKNFVGRLEVGFGLGQFFLGVGADYGL